MLACSVCGMPTSEIFSQFSWLLKLTLKNSPSNSVELTRLLQLILFGGAAECCSGINLRKRTNQAMSRKLSDLNRHIDKLLSWTWLNESVNSEITFSNSEAIGKERGEIRRIYKRFSSDRKKKSFENLLCWHSCQDEINCSSLIGACAWLCRHRLKIAMATSICFFCVFSRTIDEVW